MKQTKEIDAQISTGTPTYWLTIEDAEGPEIISEAENLSLEAAMASARRAVESGHTVTIGTD